MGRSERVKPAAPVGTSSTSVTVKNATTTRDLAAGLGAGNRFRTQPTNPFVCGPDAPFHQHAFIARQAT